MRIETEVIIEDLPTGFDVLRAEARAECFRQIERLKGAKGDRGGRSLKSRLRGLLAKSETYRSSRSYGPSQPEPFYHREQSQSQTRDVGSWLGRQALACRLAGWLPRSVVYRPSRLATTRVNPKTRP
jgi:hypothetical protein